MFEMKTVCLNKGNEINVLPLSTVLAFVAVHSLGGKR